MDAMLNTLIAVFASTMIIGPSITNGADSGNFQWISLPPSKARAVLGYSTSLYWSFEVPNAETHVTNIMLKHNDTVLISNLKSQNSKTTRRIQFTLFPTSLYVSVPEVDWQDAGLYQMTVQINVSFTVLDVLSDITSLMVYEENQLQPKHFVSTTDDVFAIRITSPNLTSLHIDQLVINVSLELEVITTDNRVDHQITKESKVCQLQCKYPLFLKAGSNDLLMTGPLQITLDYGFYLLRINHTINISGTKTTTIISSQDMSTPITRSREMIVTHTNDDKAKPSTGFKMPTILSSTDKLREESSLVTKAPYVPTMTHLLFSMKLNTESKAALPVTQTLPSFTPKQEELPLNNIIIIVSTCAAVAVIVISLTTYIMWRNKCCKKWRYNHWPEKGIAFSAVECRDDDSENTEIGCTRPLFGTHSVEAIHDL